MGKIRGWRADDENCVNSIDQRREEIRQDSIEQYGRPDVPSYVRRAAEIYADRRRVSRREALEAMIRQAGSFTELVANMGKVHRALARKASKQAKAHAEAAKLPKSPPSQYQRLIDSSKRTKFCYEVLGGAPGLGKKA